MKLLKTIQLPNKFKLPDERGFELLEVRKKKIAAPGQSSFIN